MDNPETHETPVVASKVTKAEENEDDKSSTGFTQSLLASYHGPLVKLCVASSDKIYEVSVDLLTKKSPYFAAMFQDGNFKEGIERKATLQDIDGVVSTRSLEMLIEWIYHQSIAFKSRTFKDQVSEALELLRIADMCNVQGIVEQTLAGWLENNIKLYDPDKRLEIIIPQHILSASLLPTGHAFRVAMAKATARAFIQDKEEFPFLNELTQNPSICTDIMKEMRTMVHGMKVAEREPGNARSQNPQRVDVTYPDALHGKPVRITCSVKRFERN